MTDTAEMPPTTAGDRISVMAIVSSCTTCGKKAYKGGLLVCSQCMITPYCNRQCQKKDWKHHKIYCRHSVSSIPSDATDPADVFTRDCLAWNEIHHDLLNSILPDICPERQLQKFALLQLEYIPNASNILRAMKVVAADLIDGGQVKELLGVDTVWRSIEAELKVIRRTRQGCCMLIIVVCTPDGYLNKRAVKIHVAASRIPMNFPTKGYLEVSEWFMRLKSILEDGVTREDGWGTRMMPRAEDLDGDWAPVAAASKKPE